MANWGNTDDAANSVAWAPALLKTAASTANKIALYGNTTSGAFELNEVNAQVGLSALEATGGAHAGWNLKTTGTGALTSVAISAGGSGYSNTDTFTVIATAPADNATGTIGTDIAGVITSITLTNNGANFSSATPAVTITSVSNTAIGGVITATAGGRAGRVTYETLVAMGTLV